MNAPRPEIGDDDFQAYVDGWLANDRQAAVEDYLAANPDAAARVRAYRHQGETLRAALRGPEGEDIPGRLLRAARSGGARRRASWAPRIAAAVLLLSAGLGGGWTLRGVLAPPGADRLSGSALAGDLYRQAAAAHRMYSAEVRHPVEVRAEESHLVAWLSKRVGKPLRAPELQGFGFRLMGGRLLPAGGGAAAQFMYEDAAGRRVTCYIRSDPDGTATAFRFAEENGLAAFYWLDGSLGYALVGPLQRDELLALAQNVYRHTDL